MKAGGQEAARVAACAAEWLAERDVAWSAERERTFAAWLAADERHRAAVARLERTRALFEQLPFARERVGRAVARRRRARRWSWGVAAAAVLALAAVVGWPGAEVRPAMRYATSAGGYERVLLPDGSTLELNASSEVEVKFARGERRVVLRAGEAHFTVARDEASPFLVTVGEVTVRAVGTAFNVRLAPAGVEVLVTHGKVEVTAREESAPRSEPKPLLSAGERVVVPHDTGAARPRVEAVGAGTMERALAWQERRLVFQETALRAVVAQFNRWNRTQLVLEDEALGERPVGGSFAADNVEAFVRLLESSGDIVTERRDGTIRLRRAH